MKLITTGFILLLSLLPLFTNATTYVSAGTGDWNTAATWVLGTIPSSTDDIIIADGHTITITSSGSYTHTGSIIIEEGAKLVSNVGDSFHSFIFEGDEFHVYGDLEVTDSPEKDFVVQGNSIFWGHPSAIIIVTDDWQVKGNATIILEGICVRVDDDFHLDGNQATICGGGGISIGTNAGSNELSYTNGASAAQMCIDTKIYRGVGGNCTTLVENGTTNNEPLAYDDLTETAPNTAIAIDVLNLGTPDTDADSDDLFLFKVGTDGMDGETTEGGTVVINQNGTPSDLTDDFVTYTPLTGFTGNDNFTYIIFDEYGGVSSADVTVEVKALLPVTLVDFTARQWECQILLNWSTANEKNNDYFVIEHSTNGIDFTDLEVISGNGTTATMSLYQFTDRNPEYLNYYRLRQVDFDGTITLTEVITIRNECLEEENSVGISSIYPNPIAKGEITVKVNNRELQTQASVLLVDGMGRVIDERVIDMTEGINVLNFSVDDLSPGAYSIYVNQKSKRFIKVGE